MKHLARLLALILGVTFAHGAWAQSTEVYESSTGLGSGLVPKTGTTAGQLVGASAGTDYVAPGTATAFTAPQSSTPVSLTISTSTFTPTMASGQNFQILLVHASCPCTIANPSGTLTPGTFITLAITQSSTGSDTIGTWGTDYIWPAGTKPTLSTGVSALDFVTGYINTSSQIIMGAAALNEH